MYYMFMDTMQIPIPPASMRTKINNKNRTVDLLGKGEVNILKQAGLTEVSFKFMLPNSDYPFNQSMLMSFQKASYYVDQLEALKASGQPFQFIVVRMKEDGTMLSMTNMKASLEDYSIDEDAEEGYDMYADVTLKKYVDWGAKRIEVKTDSEGNTKGTVTQDRSTTGHTIPAQVKTSAGQTLQQVVKRQLGNTSNLFAIASLNKIAVPAALAAGQVVKLGTQAASKVVLH